MVFTSRLQRVISDGVPTSSAICMTLAHRTSCMGTPKASSLPVAPPALLDATSAHLVMVKARTLAARSPEGAVSGMVERRSSATLRTPSETAGSASAAEVRTNSIPRKAAPANAEVGRFAGSGCDVEVSTWGSIQSRNAAWVVGASHKSPSSKNEDRADDETVSIDS